MCCHCTPTCHANCFRKCVAQSLRGCSPPDQDMVKFGGLGLSTNTLQIHLILISGNNNHGKCAAIAHLLVMPTVSASVLLKACVAVLRQTKTWSNLAAWGSVRTPCKSTLF